MLTPDEYRSFARECYKWAEQASSEDDRSSFLLLARHWMQAAWFSGDRLADITAQQRPPKKDD